MEAPFLRSDGPDLLLSVRLTPRSAKEGFGGIWRDDRDAAWLQASVRTVPKKGRANAALIALIARALGIAARDITLEAGDTARLKRLRLIGRAGDAQRIGRDLDRA